MRGISTLVVAILILMISVSLVSFAYIFFLRAFETVTTTTEETAKKTFTVLGADMKIEAVSDEKIYVRNTGSSVLSNFTVYIDNIAVTSSADPTSLEPGETSTITLPSPPAGLIEVYSSQFGPAKYFIPPPICTLDGDPCITGSQCCTGNCTAGTCGPCGSCGTQCSEGNYPYNDGTHTCQGNINDFCNALNGVWDTCTLTGDSRDADCTGNCQPGLTYCTSGGNNPPFYYGRCVDLDNDDCSCGTCGNDCTASGQICQDGECVSGGGLVGFWKFDDDTTDSSGNNNHGTNNGATFTSDSISGQALYFDGSDYITFSSSNNVSSDVAGKNFSVSVWLKSPTTAGQQFMISFNTLTGDNRIMLGHQAGNNVIDLFDTSWHTGTTIVIDNNWHHVAYVFDNSNDIVTLYVDGEYEFDYSSSTSIASNDLFTIGQEYDAGPITSDFFDGILDEVKIWNIALTPAEIQQEYQQYSVGLVGFWKFDGDTTDSSGNGNDGTLGPLCPDCPQWVGGISGQALDFDGDNDYVEVPNDPTLDITDEITLMAWIYHKDYDTCEIVIGRKTYSWRFVTGGTWTYGAGANTLSLQIWNEGGTQYNRYANKQITLNSWHHVAVVWDGSVIYFYIDGQPAGSAAHNTGMQSSTSPVYIGRGDGSCQGFFNGIIDEVKIYDTALTPADIQQEYLQHASSIKAGFWKFDEGTGTIAYDSSGNGNDGTLMNMESTDWVDGVSGKALEFDGVNEYVIINNIPVDTSAGSYNTVTFWMYWNGGNSQMPLGWQQPYDLWFIDSCFGFNTGENNVLGVSWNGLDNRWVHVAAIFYNGVPSDTTVSLYIDGIKENIYSCRGSTTYSRNVTSTIQISGWACGSSYYFNGKIDEVKIWDRALTEAEIQAEM